MGLARVYFLTGCFLIIVVQHLQFAHPLIGGVAGAGVADRQAVVAARRQLKLEPRNKINELSEEDKATVARARRLQRFASQPFFVAEVFTGRSGVYVSIKDTVASFKEILEGKVDTLPEQAFFLAGTTDDVRKNAEKFAG